MKILLGITGGIAAYKMLSVASKLVKKGYEVEVCMTKESLKFVTPLSFEAIVKNKVILEDSEFINGVANQHIRLANECDVMVISPATANIIAKLNAGISDDIVSLTALAFKSKKIIFPAMNNIMLEANVTQENIEELNNRSDYIVIPPEDGYLACGSIGSGRLVEPEKIVEIIETSINKNDDLIGVDVLVNAGATIEKIDPVRYITNRSSGKMGYSIAKEFIKRCANVTLVSGKTNLDIPYGIKKFIGVESANEMYDVMMKEQSQNQIIVMSAAVADYKPINYVNHKIKKNFSNFIFEMERTKDILEEVSKVNNTSIIVGFAMETEDIENRALEKLKRKKADIIVGNELNINNPVFGKDENEVIICGSNDVIKLPKLTKEEIATKLVDEVIKGNIYDKPRSFK